MGSQAGTHLLRLALPLVRSHGFTRDALANSVLHLPHPETHDSPLSDAAISSLFGQGSKAERALITFFFDEGLEHMRSRAQAISSSQQAAPSIRDVLEERLKFNVPVLEHLPEAFALLASNQSSVGTFGPLPMPLIDPIPALQHALRIADEACYLTGDTSAELSWYARRVSLAGIYTTAELHQITSPHTASEFLESLLNASSKAKQSFDEMGMFTSYVLRSFKGIAKSIGAL